MKLQKEIQSTGWLSEKKIHIIIVLGSYMALEWRLYEVKEMFKMTILGEMLREDALIEGRQEGSIQKLISLVCKKLKKGQDADQIADVLEEDVSCVENICRIAQKYAPDYDEECICREVMAK